MFLFHRLLNLTTMMYNEKDQLTVCDFLIPAEQRQRQLERSRQMAAGARPGPAPQQSDQPPTEPPREPAARVGGSQFGSFAVREQQEEEAEEAEEAEEDDESESSGVSWFVCSSTEAMRI
ncbi:unnamed protein product [Symbiodinium natans]|uniref:Uncharacterized protein n=1 Tax=Symbiodinium natans TaxID=878477 RepID=A0A812K330_9DINO|nr:unnamed protein product [Symbiodinium natans]